MRPLFSTTAEIYPVAVRRAVLDTADEFSAVAPTAVSSGDPFIKRETGVRHPERANSQSSSGIRSKSRSEPGQYTTNLFNPGFSIVHMSDQSETPGGGFWADPAGERALERYSTLVNMVDDVIYQLDAQGCFVAVNDTIIELTGYSREELLGEHVSLVLADEDVSRIQREISRRLTDGGRRDEPIEFTALTADGDTIPCELELHLLVEDGAFRGSMGVVRDITERKQVERDLRQERDLVQGIVETSPVGITVVDADGEVTFANERAEDIYGRSREEISEFSHNDPRWELVDENGEPLETGDTPFDRVVTQKEAIHDQVLGLRRPSGERVWVSVNGAPQWTEDGELERAVFAFEDVTEQRENQRKLEKSERRYRTLAEHFPNGVVGVYDHDLRYTLAAGELIGDPAPSREEVEGTRMPDLYPDAAVADLEPLFRAAIEDGETGSVQTTVVGRHWQVWATPLRDADGDIFAGLSFAQDITEQVEREAELERALDLLERTERIADVGGWEIDPQTQNVFWTDHIFDLLEVPGDEEPPLAEALDMYHDEDQPIVEDAVEEALASGDFFDVEVRLRTAASGEMRWLRLQGVPQTVHDEVVSFRGAAQDITERKERERRLEEVIERLEKSNERLEQFAYAASHDLQEPLRMVSSYLQLVEDRYADELDEDGQEFIDFAVDGADRMRDMIEGLLQYSRVETQGDEFEPVDLDEVFADVRRDLEIKIEETDAEITVEGLPRVHGDAGQLSQVCQNLLDNAIEYSGDDRPRIHVAAERNGDEWLISVSDDGIGIDPEYADRVFEVFQSLHTQGEFDGTGIGLALCERIVERHGGEIWVESEPGEGSTFSFTLPAAGEIDE